MPLPDELAAELERLQRRTIAYELRIQAQVHESLGDLHDKIAKGLEHQADAIEDGTLKIERRPTVPEAEEERRPDVSMTPITTGGVAQHGDRPEFFDAQGRPLGPAMLAWLDGFHDRWVRSPHFMQAVNEVADLSVPISDTAASTVTSRIQELEAQGGTQ